MAVFVAQPTDQQDPDALKKALLAKLLGGPIPGAVPPPGATQRSLTGTPDPGTPPAAIPLAATQPNASSTPATPITAAPGPQPAKPLGSAPPIQPSEPQHANPILSAEEFAKQNPAAPHTPYQAPDWRQRLLMGIFSGMQQFGKDPHAGEQMLSSYLGNIQKQTEEEKNYPLTAANTAKTKYSDYIAGQKGPIDLEDLKSQITERQAHARDLDAQAKARANPIGKVQHLVVEDPAHPGQPKAAYFDEAKRAYIDPDTQQPIPGAKPFEHQGVQPPTVKYDSGIPTEVTSGGKTYSIHDPNLPPDLKPIVDSAVAAHKQHLDEEAQRQAAADARSRSKSDDKRSATDSATVERETRTNIRKAQQAYRDVEEKTANMDNFLGLAKGGNKAAAQMVPVEGALQISTTAGTKRINRTEVEAYGGAGDLYDRIMGKIGKGVSGKGITDDVLDDMKTLSDVLKKAGWEKYNSEYDDEIGIAKNNGLDKIEQHLPRIQQHGGGGGNAPAAAGATAGGGAQPLPSFAEWKAKQAKP